MSARLKEWALPDEEQAVMDEFLLDDLYAQEMWYLELMEEFEEQLLEYKDVWSSIQYQHDYEDETMFS